MSDEKIRRYTMAEIEKMIAAGQYYPVPDDAPALPVDDEFWRNAKPVRRPDRTVVELDVASAAVEQFKKAGPDYLRRMADVLEKAARKAS
ncbi:MAG: hypothetical protein BGO82_18775 [Devosia sp. 67-54]|uniref:hypothetical protein n=1 Tax=unclassified Devosia TaxID=196773 RepID=UPI000962EA99|nr:MULTISPECIES: hypothetical protein [unclassified Devosia]MBN9304421.1 hypothetical protein [Devosia sp.]OJX18220.1 MAG: hypothetical protein BGO82_18775 [Devosia sp. 67-54]